MTVKVLGIGALGMLCLMACGDEGAGDSQSGVQPGDPCIPGELLICNCLVGQGTSQCGPGGTAGACFCPNDNAGTGAVGGGTGAVGGGTGAVGGGTGGMGTGGNGSGGMMGTGGMGSGGMMGTGGGGGPMVGGPGPQIPPAPPNCPTIADGTTVQAAGLDVQLWVGASNGTPGPIMFYWHGTTSNSGAARFQLGSAFNDIIGSGGIVASFQSPSPNGNGNRPGTNNGNGVWFTSDFDAADVILACAIQQHNIDPRQVYAAGCSAGGMATSLMVYHRSSWLAGAMPNSGGLVFISSSLEDPNHVPSVMTTHGGPQDMVGITFSESTATFNNDLVSKGGIVANCDHGGGHCQPPSEVITAQWRFLKDHPFGVNPDPYGGTLPNDYPNICIQLN